MDPTPPRPADELCAVFTGVVGEALPAPDSVARFEVLVRAAARPAEQRRVRAPPEVGPLCPAFP